MKMNIGQFCKFKKGLLPVMVMVIVQTSYAGMNILYKLAAADGMNLTVLVAYRLLFAAAFVLPLALFLERKNRPKLTWMVLFQSFLCGFFGGSLAQNLFAKSLALTSATFAAAMPNLNPGITFILVLSVGLEKLKIKTREGMAKVLGTAVGMGGAMVFTFYKGIKIEIWSTHVDLLHHHQQQHGGRVASSEANSRHFVWGSMLSLGSSLSFSLWLIIQAKLSRRYPAHYTSTGLMCVMGSIQSVIFALCLLEDNWSEWKLGWNIRLLTVAYTGIVTSGVMVILIAWCVHEKGPLFVSIFSPLTLVMVALAASLVLDETLHLGSILGGILIVCGLYMVLWGKSKENVKSEPLQNFMITSPLPGIQNNNCNGSNILFTSNSAIYGDSLEGERHGNEEN